MGKYTFKKGIHPDPFKELTEKKSIERMPAPKQVIIHTSQHIGAPAKPVVKIGDEVKVGQLIAESAGFISANVHSSISGKVKAIGQFPHILGKDQEAIVIESDGEDVGFEEYKEQKDYRNLTPEEMKEIVKASGIVGLGGATFPTHVKLSPPTEYKIDSLIINGAECEPYLTSDHRIMVERAVDILEGVKMVMKILEVKKAYIGIEKNKPDAIKKLREVVEEHKDFYDVQVIPLEMKYPQGGEKQLIYACCKKEVPKGVFGPNSGLPMHVGVVVQNVGTCLAILEAIKYRKPLFERVVTISGYALTEPKNLMIRVGTPFKDIIEFCKGYRTAPGKLICGGPMMGFAQYTEEVSVTKGTSGILAFPKDVLKTEVEKSCIKCCSCVDICPQYLNPSHLGQLGKYGKYEETDQYNIMNCIECGSCSYVCPSKIPLVQYIRLAKQELGKIKRAQSAKKEAK